jgi:hypothetical protein
MASNPYSNQLISALLSGVKGNTGAISTALQQSGKQQKAANTANEQRYGEGLGYLKGAEALIGQNGQAGMNRIGEQEQQGLGKAAQSAVSRGLTNTTIADSLNRGVQRDANDARLNLQESINSQQAGAKDRIADFIAARNDNGPDTNLLAGLTQGAASNPAGAQRSGSVTRQSVPGLGGAASENGLPSSFGGGSTPTDYSKLGYTVPTSGGGSISAAMSPAAGPEMTNITAALAGGGGNSPLGGIPYTPPPSKEEQAAMIDREGKNMVAEASTQRKTADPAEAKWVSKPGGGFYSKAEWEALSAAQQKNVAAGRGADQSAA